MAAGRRAIGMGRVQHAYEFDEAVSGRAGHHSAHIFAYEIKFSLKMFTVSYPAEIPVRIVGHPNVNAKA